MPEARPLAATAAPSRRAALIGLTAGLLGTVSLILALPAIAGQPGASMTAPLVVMSAAFVGAILAAAEAARSPADSTGRN
ncbi:hypothetical protein ABB55_13750 [Prosthecomicrobium hirschii]|uniref:Uncharacterized protein n=1 Tax=Prosthecodimorpha hirschii TaxID=665126 RepID=A0A0P6W1T9_9HYPH|nr:hypothetical protein [Prosthecomicrobium hirschii]KPL53148.1 hypothetical protein ABB55_13750 [Prosthecomicrobium hirschii]